MLFTKAIINLVINMLLSEKMKEQKRFSISERTVISYIFKNWDEIQDQTAKQIAEEAYTHPSILTRIAKKLGYSGWVDLKEAFVKEMYYLNNNFHNVDANFPFDETDNFMTISNKLATLNEMTIEDTLSLIDYNALKKAVEYLNTASEIKIFSLENNLQLCYAFKSHMMRIGKKVTLCTFDQGYEASTCSEDTCVIIISYTGETTNILKLLPMIRKKKATIISLTSIGDNTLVKQSDYLFRITTREKLYSKIGNFTLNNSITFLLDIFYSCIFSEAYKDNIEFKVNISKYYDSRKSSNKVMREEE